MDRIERERNLSLAGRRRYGVVIRSQLLAMGYSEAEIDRRLASGRLDRRHRDVYVLAGVPESYEQHVCAAVLAAGPTAVASHRSGCALWGIRAPGIYGVQDEPPVELTVVTRRHPRLDGVIVHRSTDLVAAHVTERVGIPVTNPLRLLVDLGAVAPDFLVERALDELLVKRLVTVDAVRAMLGRVARPGRRGCGVLRQVLERRALGDAIPDGMIEPVMANLLRDHDLPMPVFQHELIVAGRRRRLDFAYPGRLIAIEVDGWETHGTHEAFRADRARDDELAAIGWICLRFTWDDVVGRPGWVASIVRAALASRPARRL
jgi:very-short-patch-repair endonuclease